MDFKSIRGFNYQPSYGSSGLELWQLYQPETIRKEIFTGMSHFPWINTIRFWLSWDAFKRNEERFLINFDHFLSLAHEYGFKVMPVLFNRWHTSSLDYGGIYLEHFLPKASWMQKPGLFEPYIDAVVGRHAGNQDIIAWDLCNEPFSYGSFDISNEIVNAEVAWLQDIYTRCKRFSLTAPITIGQHSGFGFDQTLAMSDVISIHPYYLPGASKTDYEAMLDTYVEKAAKARKSLIATETCWGSYDDTERVDIIGYTLDQLNRRQIGWLAYLLHTSAVADAHDHSEGAFSKAGNLAFIRTDGTLRTGHNIINSYACP